MTTHVLTAPEQKGVTRWLYDPSSQKQADAGGWYFYRQTGKWRHRGHKKWDPVLVLVAVDENGDEVYNYRTIAAPCDGYVHGLPSRKRYFRPGETIATFSAAYIYHWRFHDQRHRRRARVFKVILHRFPRVRHGLHLGIAILGAIIGSLMILAGDKPIMFAGFLLFVASSIIAIAKSLLTILGGEERTYDFMEKLFGYTQFWRVFCGVLALGLIGSAGYELIFERVLGFRMLLLGLFGFIAMGSMATGTLYRGPPLSRFWEFLYKRLFKKRDVP